MCYTTEAPTGGAAHPTNADGRSAHVRWSHALIPTLKETPADAVVPSHVLFRLARG